MENYTIVHAEKYNSLREFLNVINSRENNSVMRGQYESRKKGKDFAGTSSYEEATELMLKGWVEVLPEIKKQFEGSVKHNANGSIDRRRTFNHVVGYAPNVPNAILGLPQSMINQKKEAQKVKVVSLVYAPCANCGTDSDTYIKAGIVVLNIVNQLELNGIRTNLMIAAKDSAKQKTFCNCLVTVKNYREQLDLKKVAFPIANPSMQRRFGFKWIETVPNLLEMNFRYGYGHTVSNETNHKDVLVKHGIIKESDYFLTLERIEELKFDISVVMKDAGIKI